MNSKVVTVVVLLSLGVLAWAVVVHHLGAPPLPITCVPPDHVVTSWVPESQDANVARSITWFGSREIGGCGQSLTITTGAR
jgi:hypothetical protein